MSSLFKGCKLHYHLDLFQKRCVDDRIIFKMSDSDLEKVFGEPNFGDYVTLREALPAHARASNNSQKQLYTNNDDSQSSTRSNSDSPDNSQQSMQSASGSQSEDSAFLFYDHHKTGQLVKLPNDNKTIVNDYLSFSFVSIVFLIKN